MRFFGCCGFFMQTNLVRSRKRLCETRKHDRILMYTNWMAFTLQIDMTKTSAETSFDDDEVMLIEKRQAHYAG